tara:strand:- start:35 stop:484 length:450 start_codon:yes stop_codon:yes gene_type:complete
MRTPPRGLDGDGYPLPGMFGRFRQEDPVPTGGTALGGPTTMNIQQNPDHPMGPQFGVGAAPGAQVQRMPHPSPFVGTVPSASHAGQGYTVNDAGEFVRPENPHQTKSTSEDFERRLNLPIGAPGSGGGDANSVAQSQAGDQFSRQTRQF